jgi:hypothetical protein
MPDDGEARDVDRRTRDQLRGAVELVRDGVEAVARETENVHRELMRRPYAVLARIPAVAGPSRAIELFHGAIAGVAYASVRAVNQVVATAVVTALVDRDESPAAAGPTPSR